MILIEIINIARSNTVHEIINHLRSLFSNTFVPIFIPSCFWALCWSILANLTIVSIQLLVQHFVGSFEILSFIVILLILNIRTLIFYYVCELTSSSNLRVNCLHSEIWIKRNIFFSNVLLVHVVCCDLVDGSDHVLGVVGLRTARKTRSVYLSKPLNVIFQFWLCVYRALICLDYWIVLLRKMSFIHL